MKALEELFDISYGVNLEVVNCEVVESGVPFVSRQSVNNGVSCHVREIPEIAPNAAGTLSIAGGGSILSTFYHDRPYYSGRDIYVATPRHPMSVEEMLFYRYAIEKNRYRYNYGRQANRTLRRIRVPEYKDAVRGIRVKRLPGFSRMPVNAPLALPPLLKWKAFRYSELFDICKGKRLTKEAMQDGTIPFIGATDANNGITAYIANDENLHPGNLITVSYNGSIAEAFYQPEPFVASDDINVLYPKFTLDRFIGIFLCTLIRREKYRYNYGRKWHKEIMEKSEIRLPVTSDAVPDFALMRRYIEGLAYSSQL